MLKIPPSTPLQKGGIKKTALARDKDARVVWSDNSRAVYLAYIFTRIGLYPEKAGHYPSQQHVAVVAKASRLCRLTAGGILG
jgi:hypothetical protein